MQNIRYCHAVAVKNVLGNSACFIELKKYQYQNHLKKQKNTKLNKQTAILNKENQGDSQLEEKMTTF